MDEGALPAISVDSAQLNHPFEVFAKPVQSSVKVQVRVRFQVGIEVEVSSLGS